MHSVTKTGRFVVNSNLWVSLAASAWAGMGQLLMKQYAWEWCILIFGATYCAYHFQRFYAFTQVASSDITSERNLWYQKHANILHTLALIWAIISGYYFLQLNLNWHAFITPLLLVFFYKVPLPFLNKNFRSLPYLKVFIITGVWTYVLAYVWMDTSFMKLSLDQWIFIIMTALIVFSTSIPFDYRDRHSDKGTLISFPMKLSQRGIFIMIYLPYLIMCILFLFFFRFDVWSLFNVGLGNILLLYLLRKMFFQAPSDHFYAWAFDGFILFNALVFSIHFL